MGFVVDPEKRAEFFELVDLAEQSVRENEKLLQQKRQAWQFFVGLSLTGMIGTLFAFLSPDADLLLNLINVMLSIPAILAFFRMRDLSRQQRAHQVVVGEIIELVRETFSRVGLSNLSQALVRLRMSKVSVYIPFDRRPDGG